MRVLLILLTIAAMATATISADDDFKKQINELMDNLSSKLQQDVSENVKNMIESTIKLVKTASLAGDSPLSQEAIESAKKSIAKIENIMNGGPATRASAINIVADIVGKRSQLLGEVLNKFAANMEANGNKPLAAVLKAASETIKEKFLTDDKIRSMANKAADVLDMVEDGVALLNDFTGGMIPQLNTISSVIQKLDSASDALLDRKQDDDSKNVIVSKVLGVLYKMKNSKNQFAFDAIGKVCKIMNSADAA